MKKLACIFAVIGAVVVAPAFTSSLYAMGPSGGDVQDGMKMMHDGMMMVEEGMMKDDMMKDGMMKDGMMMVKDGMMMMEDGMKEYDHSQGMMSRS